MIDELVGDESCGFYLWLQRGFRRTRRITIRIMAVSCGQLEPSSTNMVTTTADVCAPRGERV